MGVTKLLIQFQGMKFDKNEKVGNKNNNFRLKRNLISILE